MNSSVRARLLPYRVFEGSMNMALDEAILDRAISVDDTNSLSLRFYGWRPEAVSIGYGQKLPFSDRERIVEKGFDLVKRPTGGRAVLHSGELTYSFVGHGSLLGGSIASAIARSVRGLSPDWLNWVWKPVLENPAIAVIETKPIASLP